MRRAILAALISCMAMLGRLEAAPRPAEAAYFNTLQAIKTCRLHSELGFRSGLFSFKHDFPACAAYFYYAPALGEFLRTLRLEPASEEDLGGVCYRSAWIRGYLSAHSGLWGRCDEELTDGIGDGLSGSDCGNSTAGGEMLGEVGPFQGLSEGDLVRHLLHYLDFEDWARAWEVTLKLERLKSGVVLQCLSSENESEGT